MIDTVWQRWADLSPDRLYAFLKLRSDVFVVEQNCVFPEMDGIDPQCLHLCLLDAQHHVVAYARLVPPGIQRPHSESPAAAGPAIGRVVVAPAWRGRGIARQLMTSALQRCAQDYPAMAVAISAQQHLESFYASLGFVTQTPPYLEDGIWHVDMQREPG